MTMEHVTFIARQSFQFNFLFFLKKKDLISRIGVSRREIRLCSEDMTYCYELMVALADIEVSTGLQCVIELTIILFSL